MTDASGDEAVPMYRPIPLKQVRCLSCSAVISVEHVIIFGESAEHVIIFAMLGKLVVSWELILSVSGSGNKHFLSENC